MISLHSNKKTKLCYESNEDDIFWGRCQRVLLANLCFLKISMILQMSLMVSYSSKLLRLNGSPGQYQVVKCGVSGHNIRTRPCLRAPPVGILVMGSKFYAVDEVRFTAWITL